MTQGNKRKQRRNRRRNNRQVPKLDQAFMLIDGNPTYQPFGYCWHYQGYLTRNQAIRHRCLIKQCRRFEIFEHHQQHIAEKEIQD